MIADIYWLLFEVIKNSLWEKWQSELVRKKEIEKGGEKAKTKEHKKTNSLKVKKKEKCTASGSKLWAFFINVLTINDKKNINQTLDKKVVYFIIKLSRGGICVANFILPFEWGKSG